MRLLAAFGVSPTAVVEPTCGLGSFLDAAHEVYPHARFWGFDRNPDLVSRFRSETKIPCEKLSCRVQDFFAMDWKALFRQLTGERVLLVGNPPWVTNSAMGAIGGTNVPVKSNFQGLKGFEAKTGKANFDISEWMIMKLLEQLGNQPACLAMLCKMSTARKALKHFWTNGFAIEKASLHVIDARSAFHVAVKACFLIVKTGNFGEKRADVYADLSFSQKTSAIGMVRDELIADVEAFQHASDLNGCSPLQWRSGVKHDAARIMEFAETEHGLVNGMNEVVSLEMTRVFPLLKSSDLAKNVLIPTRCVLVTQTQTGEDTSRLQQSAPLTWEYLLKHREVLDRRQSVIYQKRPRFAVFGIGPYTFSPWKVAISGLYKNVEFRVIGSKRGKPIVLDDTCYFVPCQNREEATLIADLLNSPLCRDFVRSLIFFDAKRPVTIEVLRRIDLMRLAERMGRGPEMKAVLSKSLRESVNA
jgi:hypothetical protein